MAANEENPSPADVFAGLVRVVHLIGLAGAQELAREGITPAQYQVLVRVHRNPPMVQRELTDVLGVTKGNVSQLLTRLQDAGLLERAIQGAANRISLTAAGESLVRRLMPAHERFLARSFAALDADQLRLLAELTARLEASV